MREGRGVSSVFVGKREGKRPLGRPRRRWKDNMIFRKYDMSVWSESSWLMIGTVDRHL